MFTGKCYPVPPCRRVWTLLSIIDRSYGLRLNFVLAVLKAPGECPFSVRRVRVQCAFGPETFSQLRFCLHQLSQPRRVQFRRCSFQYARTCLPGCQRCHATERACPGLNDNILQYTNSFVTHDAVPAQYKPLLFPAAFPAPTNSIRFPRLRDFNLSHSKRCFQDQERLPWRECQFQFQHQRRV